MRTTSGVPAVDPPAGDAPTSDQSWGAAGSRRPAPGRRAAALASWALAAVLVAGCSGGTAEPAASSAGSPSGSSTEPSAAPAEPSDPAGEDADAGTEGQDTADQSTADEGTAGAGSSGGQSPSNGGTGGDGTGGGSSGGGTEGLPGWPIESTPVHGGQFWAAYVAVGAPGDPALQQVLADVQELWPGASLGELGCDQGAAAALGRDSAEHAVAVYFPTEQHITEFRRRWGAPYVGAARVTTLCGD
ncbi:hypothetical protein [Geodermatophilus sp. CPCC 206100]|uniref:hypothetical protein n=1 Tax=Geodermatophilus sp. CPCC 206100 TaxID=3020054 RepID=UPI003B004716